VDNVDNKAPQDADLARFQAALLELLSQPLGADEMARRLREDEAFAPFQDYVAGFEPRMIEVAAALTKKWGRRSDGQG
jgi:hypothetical protein